MGILERRVQGAVSNYKVGIHLVMFGRLPSALRRVAIGEE